ncbi:MAG: hypothetical protein H6642_18120 [Caldilineaceae bacterium]|nr:hypothetical protein [Caldilineaceae bacterium]MCB9140260.1 hypothetical protein [Caldilineaceae bacterium]
MRRLLFWLGLLLFIFLLQPRESLARMQHLWAQRNRVLSVLVICLAIYLLYGLFSFYRRGGLQGF